MSTLYYKLCENRQAEMSRAKLELAASATETTLVAATTGQRIVVLAVFALSGDTGTDLTFLSNSTEIFPTVENANNGGFVLPLNEAGWFETTAGEALKVTSGAGSTTAIQVLYVKLP